MVTTSRDISSILDDCYMELLKVIPQARIKILLLVQKAVIELSKNQDSLFTITDNYGNKLYDLFVHYKIDNSIYMELKSLAQELISTFRANRIKTLLSYSEYVLSMNYKKLIVCRL